MTTTVITINETDADHLAHVIEQMRVLGAPTIRCARDEARGVLLALEGSHRIAAAIKLGIAPHLVALDDDTMLDCEEIGYDDCGWFDGEPAAVGDIRDRIAGANGTYDGCPIYTVGE
jgi:hypothetical protein